VNGATGRVEHIAYDTTGMVTRVVVKFNNETCGHSQPANHRHPQFTGAIAIHRVDGTFVVSRAFRYKRKQFPLHVAYATTIHKCQAKTLNDIVVSMAGRYSEGQAYVALSRVTSLEGLTSWTLMLTRYIHRDVQ
jgi:ATP-dependent DNA helicase PIF1